ncbi:PQQ-dependent sugar dehydrogenase [Methyloceanibacter sp. wino2]|uniref:PQQ-dependent sugar dehydrogenase n=1 Tax=Methyloceanibacter sp. wino2 TaxID=2170729 RepID=UPI000D3E7F5E|nr:PQQ-dependent sugar dehydrogenase [Methyloceanibacter sp. wino2]
MTPPRLTGLRKTAAHYALAGLIAVLALDLGPAAAQQHTIDTEAGPIRVETVAEGLKHPWGMAFLPDGRMLVTERPGTLRLVDADGTLSEPLSGVPEVVAQGQGGLLDVALDPTFMTNKLIYLSYAEAGDDGVGTTVARGRLEDGGLTDLKVIFQQTPKVKGPNHFGGRLAFAPDGTLFITLGDRFKFEPAQDLSSHLGKVVRINPDGSVPQDNPFIGQKDAQPEIWSLGHRNVESASIDPQTGKLWTLEFGPKGGDELNRPAPGENYGWPLVSWGTHYDGKDIPNPPTRPEFADAVRQWTPVISPSGATFYTAEPVPGWTSEAIAAWAGDLLVGGLSSESIVRLSIDGDKVTGEERIPLGIRIRNVVQGPDGAVYALTDEDDGKILRLTTEDQ